jgi:adenylate cyclase
VHGLSVLNLLRRDWLERWPRLVEWGILVLTGAWAGFFLAARRPLAALGLAGAAMLGVVLGGAVLHWYAEQWFAWLILSGVQIPLALGWSVALNAICDYRDKEILSAALSVHFSPARVKQLLKHPDWLRPGAERREASLLFTDIQNFSKVTALMHPEDLVRLLNAYYEQALKCVHRTDGTIMDLVGDSIFALWNAPENQSDHRERACQAAGHLQQAFRDFDAKNPGPPLRTRIGLHGGTVWIGNIGSSCRFDYAALGEAVNLASRLERLNKTLGTEILATREIQRASSGILASRLMGHFAFQGIDQPVEVYELFPLTEEEIPRQQMFAQALHGFQRREFAEAERGFRAVLQECAGDGPSLFYCDKIKELQDTTLAPDWIGILQVDGK